MAFWVSGRDAVTGEPGRMLCDAATPELAREQAREQGLIADEVSPAAEPETPLPARRSDRPLPAAWFIGLGIGLLGSCVWSAALDEVYRGLGRGDLARAAVIALYLALPGLLIWWGVSRLRAER